MLRLYHRVRPGSHFLWHCLYPGPLYPGTLPVRKHGALSCPDFPLAAMQQTASVPATERTVVAAKIRIIREMWLPLRP